MPPELLPPDDIAEGYDTVGHDQQFSSYHFEGYQKAARSIVAVALQWVDVPRGDSKQYINEPENRTNAHLKDYINDYDEKMARIKAGATHEELGIDDEKQLQLFVKRYAARPEAENDICSVLMPIVASSFPTPVAALTPSAPTAFLWIPEAITNSGLLLRLLRRRRRFVTFSNAGSETEPSDISKWVEI